MKDVVVAPPPPPPPIPLCRYLLPRATWPCLFSEALRLPYLHIEDVFVCGFSSARCAFPKKHFNGFHCGIFPVKLETAFAGYPRSYVLYRLFLLG